MTRFTDDEITKLKGQVSLLSLVKDQGYHPVRQDKDHAIHCPFHAGDDTPSLVISSNNLFHCFGCDVGGR